jgi:hypothetical protein
LHVGLGAKDDVYACELASVPGFEPPDHVEIKAQVNGSLAGRRDHYRFPALRSGIGGRRHRVMRIGEEDFR